MVFVFNTPVGQCISKWTHNFQPSMIFSGTLTILTPIPSWVLGTLSKADASSNLQH